MDRAVVNAICAGFPGAECSDPWGGGHDCWKVGGKMFANIGARGDGVTLKCADADTAEMLIDLGRAERAPYMPRGGWVFFAWDGLESAEAEERLRASYDTVRAGLPKRVQASLG